VREDRVANIRANAEAFGVMHKVTIITGSAPAALASLDKPDAAFIGGGLDAAMFDSIWALMPDGARLVAHCVTLETEALLSVLQQGYGGELMRIDISHAMPLGRMRSWEASRPVVQWHVVKKGRP